MEVVFHLFTNLVSVLCRVVSCASNFRLRCVQLSAFRHWCRRFHRPSPFFVCHAHIIITASSKSTIRKCHETISVFLISVLIFLSSSFHPNNCCSVRCVHGDPLCRLFDVLQNHSKTKLFRQFNDAMFVISLALFVKQVQFLHSLCSCIPIPAATVNVAFVCLMCILWASEFIECTNWCRSSCYNSLAVCKKRQRRKEERDFDVVIIIIVVVDVGSDSRFHEWNAM